tara:strand:- start:3 stop:311 length:309 start_codon:yes stop_codon:yes gene_type:complete
MKYTKILILMLMMLNSCTSLKEAGKVLRNEKTTTTDEFLVKKKQSLIFPPDYNSLPKPGELKVKKADETQKIKEMLKAGDSKKINEKNSSSVENSILKKIRK